MATDATGTPTAKGIPKYNTAVDVPSGKGFNAAMDAIDGVLGYTKVRKNSGGSDFERGRLNLIEGSNITLTVADDVANNEVDVTVASTAAVTGFGTALPGSPNDGDHFILTDSTTAPTYQWLLRYVAAKVSNKWIYIGGTPLSATVATSESTASGTYVALTTAGPSVTIPVAGDYLVTIGCNSGGNEGFMSYDIGATGAVDADGVSDYAGSGSWREKKKTGLTAVTLTAKYRSYGGTPSFSDRYIAIEPIAIGG